MSSTYQYEALPAGKWLRLLRLLPGVDNEQIHLELFAAELETASSYETISYRWGDHHEHEEVICNEQTIHLMRSLFTGLKCFRHPDKSRILWADAICINQSDDEEKRIQVNMMGDIYDRALGVLIWLGDVPSDIGQKAFRYLRAINEYIDSQIVESELAVDPWVAVANVPQVQDGDSRFSDMSEADAFYDFWLCPWFSRVWVLQEVALASTALVYYGANCISFSEVMQAAYLLSWREDLQDGFPVGAWADAFYHTLIWYTTKQTWMQEKALLQAWQSALMQRNTPSLNKVLFSSARFDASNPLDHIYGFLAHPTARVKDGTSGIIQADYTIDIDEACRRLAEALFERDQRLDFLCSLSHWELSDIEDDPSWIPQIAMPKLAYSIEHETWQADGVPGTGTIPPVKAVIRGNVLHAWGIILDEVGVCSERFVWDSFEAPNPTPTEICWNLYKSIEHKRSRRTTPWHSLKIAMVAGIYVGGDDRWNLEFKAYCQEKISLQFWKDIGAEELDEEDDEWEDVEWSDGEVEDVHRVEAEEENLEQEQIQDDGPWQRFHRTHWNALQGRKFFITDDQCRFGVGPALLEKGDLCCILLGCKMPIIIRPTPIRWHFKVLGTAYIESAMQGETARAYIQTSNDLLPIILV